MGSTFSKQRKKKEVSSPVCGSQTRARQSSLKSTQGRSSVLLGMPVLCLLPQPCWCAIPLQFVRMALAHELLSQQGGPSSAYYLALARTCLLKEEFSKCEECLCEAIRIDFLVILLVFAGAGCCPKAADRLNAAADSTCVVCVCVNPESMFHFHSSDSNINLQQFLWGRTITADEPPQDVAAALPSSLPSVLFAVCHLPRTDRQHF